MHAGRFFGISRCLSVPLKWSLFLCCIRRLSKYFHIILLFAPHNSLVWVFGGFTWWTAFSKSCCWDTFIIFSCINFGTPAPLAALSCPLKCKKCSTLDVSSVFVIANLREHPFSNYAEGGGGVGSLLFSGLILCKRGEGVKNCWFFCVITKWITPREKRLFGSYFDNCIEYKRRYISWFGKLICLSQKSLPLFKQ